MAKKTTKSAAEREKFVKDMYKAGIDAGLTDAAARVMASQAAIESNYGASAPGNNFFGIKAGKSWEGDKQLLWTTEVQDGKRVRVQQYFRSYDSPEAGIADRVVFMDRAYPGFSQSATVGDAMNSLLNGRFGRYYTENQATYEAGINQVNTKYLGGTPVPPGSIPGGKGVATQLDVGMTGSVQIKSGDTLSGLAKKYGTTVAALQKANGIKDANKIQAGQNLVIPGLADKFPRQVLQAEKAFQDSTKGLATSTVGTVQRNDMNMLDSISGSMFPAPAPLTPSEPYKGPSIGEQIMNRILPSSVTQRGSATQVQSAPGAPLTTQVPGRVAPVPMTPPPGLRAGTATAQGQSTKAGASSAVTPKQTEYAILASGKKIATGRHTTSSGKEVIISADENGKAVIKPIEIPFYIKELGNDTIVGGIARREAAAAAEKAAAAATQKVAEIGSGLGGMLGGIGGLFGGGSPQTAVAAELSVSPPSTSQKSGASGSSGSKSSSSSQSSSSSSSSGKVLKGSATGTQYKEGQIVTTSSGKQKVVVDNGSGVAKFVEI